MNFNAHCTRRAVKSVEKKTCSRFEPLWRIDLPVDSAFNSQLPPSTSLLFFPRVVFSPARGYTKECTSCRIPLSLIERPLDLFVSSMLTTNVDDDSPPLLPRYRSFRNIVSSREEKKLLFYDRARQLPAGGFRRCKS